MVRQNQPGSNMKSLLTSRKRLLRALKFFEEHALAIESHRQLGDQIAEPGHTPRALPQSTVGERARDPAYTEPGRIGNRVEEPGHRFPGLLKSSSD